MLIFVIEIGRREDRRGSDEDIVTVLCLLHGSNIVPFCHIMVHILKSKLIRLTKGKGVENKPETQIPGYSWESIYQVPGRLHLGT
jgi:hypothetical protein